ncbi:uncharacterized protein B0H18DRAFT_958346 [Fomitopsis serialis]|uniref:uncharacterized protein n=1 Tax=Fomitopsis serialis TaxID=139415 RepID=UPI002007B7AC|nr:uncharacterized protein B0H18DRAFT_958346 [Neoantrodia serialis]KAH9917503.1 hypothetical protein B0H18DRAFT_958346 [Neoantrodia serialis]
MATSEPEEVPPPYAAVFMTEYYTANYCTVAISALIVYEHMITILDEVQHFWHGRLTGSKVLFFTNRYALLGFALFNLGGMAPSNTALNDVARGNSCGGLSVVLNLCIFILYATEAVFAALRAFAISGFNWPAALLVLILGSLTIWPNIYLIAKTTYYLESYGSAVACANTPDVSGESYYRCAVSAILCDALVLAITWWRTWGIKKAAEHARMSTPLVTILLRDALNIAQAVVQIYDGAIDYLSYFLTPLPAICISRFLFNLHSSSSLSQLATASTSQSETAPAGNTWAWELPGEQSEHQTEGTEMTAIEARHVGEA